MAPRRPSRSRWSDLPDSALLTRPLATCIALALAGGAVAGTAPGPQLAVAVAPLTGELSLSPDAPRGAARAHTEAGGVPVPAVQANLGNAMPQRTEGPAEPAHATEALVLDVVVNSQALPEPQIVRRRGGMLWLSPETLAAARLQVPAEARADADGWVALESLAGHRHTMDDAAMRLEFTAAPEYFVATRVHPGYRADRERIMPAVAPLGAILSYDIGSTLASGGGFASTALLDAAVSRGRASCRGRHLWRSQGALARLDTSCYVDWPDQRLSLVLGDAVSRASRLTGPVRYGGMRFGTDFGLDPDLRTQPLLGVEGSARLPSVLEIWLGQQQALRSQLPPGPFEVDGIAPRSGRGELQAVITDALGRRVLLEGAIYSDPNLLRRGLTDWAVEAGRLRQGFLRAGDEYGDAFGLITLRRGIASAWTMEARAEWQSDHALLGLANYLRLGYLGVLEVSGAAQRTAGEQTETAYALGYSYQGYRWSMGLRHAAYGPHYRDLAWQVPGTAPRRDDQASMGVRLGRVSLSGGAILRRSTLLGEQRLLRAGISAPVGSGFLSLGGIRSAGAAERTSYSLAYTLPLAHSNSLSAGVRADGGTLTPTLAVQRSLPVGPGYGYRVQHEQVVAGGRSQAEAIMRGNAGALTAAFYQDDRTLSGRFGVRGAVVASAQGAFLAADDDGSFAVVRMPGPGVEIQRENQVVATTRANGTALVSGLRPFQRNRLGVEAGTLDLATRVERTRMEVVPGRRQVLVADFGASHVTSMTLRVTGADGQPIPPGALAASRAIAAETQVGFEGLLYLDIHGDPAPVTITWRDRACTVAAASLPATADPADVHEVQCR